MKMNDVPREKLEKIFTAIDEKNSPEEKTNMFNYMIFSILLDIRESLYRIEKNDVVKWGSKL